MGVVADDLIGDYRKAAAFFGEALTAVRDDDWANPTPCEGWDVRSLVAHLIVGEAMAAGLFQGGGGAPTADVDTTVLGPSPMATWRGTALAALQAAGADGVLDNVYPHPVGELSGSVIVGFRVTENLVHGWDLARACGIDVEVPGDPAERCLDFWLPLVGSMDDSAVLRGSFGEPVLPPEDAPAGVRLLALLGRNA
ncbi:MAG: TIGR03086 family protein [Actinobacteria bacterium]|nr:TIGR03086 family protein [Actinomycetota bacterium]